MYLTYCQSISTVFAVICASPHLANAAIREILKSIEAASVPLSNGLFPKGVSLKSAGLFRLRWVASEVTLCQRN